MTTKQPLVGQIQGRGERIKATESHFNMACLDDVRQALPTLPPQIVDASGYAEAFDNIYLDGEKLNGRDS